MGKKKISWLYDLLYYGLFTLIPIIAYVVHLHHFDNVTLISFFEDMGILNTNVIFTAFVDMFGTNGYLPLIDDSSVLFYMFTYIGIVTILHLVLDFIIFIPRLAHKYMTYFCNKE